MLNCNLFDALHYCSEYLEKCAFSPESKYWLSSMINLSNSFLHFKSSLHFTTEFNRWFHNNKWLRDNVYSQTPFYRRWQDCLELQKKNCDSISVTRTFILLTQSNTPLPADVCVYCSNCLCTEQVCISLFCVRSFKNSRKHCINIFLNMNRKPNVILRGS